MMSTDMGTKSKRSEPDTCLKKYQKSKMIEWKSGWSAFKGEDQGNWIRMKSIAQTTMKDGACRSTSINNGKFRYKKWVEDAKSNEQSGKNG